MNQDIVPGNASPERENAANNHNDNNVPNGNEVVPEMQND